MPSFFGYDAEIYDCFSAHGYDVDVIYENVDDISYYYRMHKIYFPGSMQKVCNRYYRKKIKANTKYDCVLVVRGSTVTPEILEYLKSNHSSDRCSYVLYQWDSTDNNPNALKIAGYFDRILTFDQADALKYGWKYRPLFFIPKYVREKERKTDFVYNCSLHSKRVDVLNSLEEICKERGYSLSANIYCKRLLYFKGKYLNHKPEFVNANKGMVSFKPVSIGQSYDLYNQSRIVVDYTHPNQKGFTMRTIESLGAGCKLVTNNTLIRKADFYNPGNIYVYDEDHFELPEQFVNEPYKEIDKEVYASYSLDAWINDLVSPE